MCKTIYWDHDIGLVPSSALTGPSGEMGTEVKTVGWCRDCITVAWRDDKDVIVSPHVLQE